MTDPGTLYIVSTPIGNLQDITLRALEILRSVDLVAAEDTRVTRNLLHHFGIDRPLTSFHEHNARASGARLVKKLQSGETIALVSDAGTPGISDPGYVIINLALDSGVTVVPIPGVTALVTALSACGLPTHHFLFLGFPPRRKGRSRFFQRLAAATETVVFYESPHRFHDALARLNALLPGRRLVVARELTKLHEEFQRGSVSELWDRLGNRQPKGELVLILEGPSRREEKQLFKAVEKVDHEG
jgi:16S rRNA (cytidine1402-2'-O)-methyltransferase